jgi:hypothetical protein
MNRKEYAKNLRIALKFSSKDEKTSSFPVKNARLKKRKRKLSSKCRKILSHEERIL